MDKSSHLYRSYIDILDKELLPVMGCTEPIAVASCAAKIASAVDAGILGYEMYINGQQFYGVDGIISKGIENTIKNIGTLGSHGMFQTDKEIIKIMTCVD